MRVELLDCRRTPRVLTTADTGLAGQWFSEQLADVVSANASDPPWELRVWPMNEIEFKTLIDKRSGHPGFLDQRLDAAGLEEIGHQFLAAAQRARSG